MIFGSSDHIISGISQDLLVHVTDDIVNGLGDIFDVFGAHWLA